MSTAPAAAAAPGTEAQPPKKSRKLVLIVVCVVAIAGGAAAPMAFASKPKGDKPKAKGEAKTAVVPFGEVVVNLAEERQQRYLRTKVALLVEADGEKEVTDLVAKKKAAVKSAMIVHLSGKVTKDVSGSVGIQRMQRELLERVEEVLYPDGNSRVRSVLFEEYVVQ